MVYDVLIVGGGIIGLNIARNIKRKEPSLKVALIEKEKSVAMHSSGRNSGVLHAGFYYTSDSLKAKFTKEGNRLLKEFCKERGLKINECQKVVVAQNEEELEGLKELKRRGEKNGVSLEWLDKKELERLFPEADTYEKALLSPTTAKVDPKEVTEAFEKEARNLGVKIFLDTKYLQKLSKEMILTNRKIFKFKTFINAAGLYADKIAKEWDAGEEFVIIPFKGIYLKDSLNSIDLSTNIYPVPNLKNPFLGVHFTLTVNNEAKIGPTAIPAFWRENYEGLENFNLSEMAEILYYEAKLFLTNAFGFRDLAIEEMKKYNKEYFLSLAKALTKKRDLSSFNKWSAPGIRAQLLNKKSLKLVQDFVVEKRENSIHVLNAVSPAFTSSIPFTEWIVENYFNPS